MKRSVANRFSRLITVCLILALLASSTFASEEPESSPNLDAQPSDGPVALTNVAEVTTSLIVNDEVYSGGDLTVTYGDTFVLGIGWKFSNNYVIQSGDIFTYSLPDCIFPQFEAISGTLLNGGNAVGTYTFSDDGVLTLAYNNVSDDALGGRSNVTGRVEIEGQFDSSAGFVNQHYSRSFDIGEGRALLVMEQTGGSGALSINKAESLAVSDNERRWVVMIRSEGSNTNVVIEDKMGEYLSLPAGVEPIITRAALDAAWDTDGASAWSIAEQAETVNRSTCSCSTNERGFTLRFDQLSEGTYYIRYESDFDYKDALDHVGVETSVAKRTNTASVCSDQMTEPLTASSSIPLAKQWISKSGVFLSPSVIEWTVKVNGAPACEISGYHLKDILGSGQEYRSGTLRLDGGLLPDSDWDRIQNGEWQFLEGITAAEHTITYQVNVTAPDDAYFSNTAMIGPTGDDLGNRAYAETDSFTRSYIIKSGGKDTLLGMLEWNFKLRDITSAFASNPITMIDTLPAGTEYVDGSLSVKSGSGSIYMAQMNINRDIDRYITVEKLGVDEAGRQQLRLTITPEFLQRIVDWASVSWNEDAQAIITYKTKIIAQDSAVESYTNSFTANHADWNEISGSASVDHTIHDFVTKSAEYTSHTAPYVNYTVIVNPESFEKDADSITVEDELGTALALEMGSVKLFEPGELLDNNGTLIDVTDTDDNEITGCEYNYDFDTRTLTIMGLPADRALKITYRCILDLAEGETLTNENANNVVKISGMKEGIETAEARLYGKALRPSGTTSGKYACITLYKYSAEDVTCQLSGAYFMLEDLFVDRSTGEVTGVRNHQELSTDEAGYIQFSNVSYDHLYRVLETKAPEGYTKGQDAYYVVFAGNDGYDWANMTLRDETGNVIPAVEVLDGGVNNVNLNIQNEKVITPSPTFEPTPGQRPAPTSVPKTGDDNHVALYLAIFMLSFTVLLLTICSYTRKRQPFNRTFFFHSPNYTGDR